MRERTPQSIHLKDYQPPAFLVDHVDLHIDLAETATRVTSRLNLRRNPEAGPDSLPLQLDGENLRLISVKIDGQPVAASAYEVKPDCLTVHVPPSPFELETVAEIDPSTNTELEGLYLSGGMFCTQCEAQGFRKITYFPDRPDVMATYRTTLVADKSRFPVLLSNGNLEGAGDLLNGRHWATWFDPFRKPCYLFALVAGQLECVEDRFTTASGGEVMLRIFAEAQDIDKCAHAMASLKHAMRWDEERFGREYDLDLYMIVAVSHFNMGAMENKGLNLFNTKYVLARPDTATDADYEHIEGVIAHEYFHNWTGNRITCRDWFQLSLKEGLTVFRDQEFSSDRHSRAVKRIDEVNMLRTRQFAEDAGPLAHPVRPESYIEINNFYTVTVYEKGAEVIRMLHTLLGADSFRRGTDLYFQRHDGQAVTCEDFVRCMEDANEADLGQFRLWYSQAGTPEVSIESSYDAGRGELELTITQNCPPTPGQPRKAPMHIPLAIGLLGQDGEELPVCLDGGAPRGQDETTRVLELRQARETFRLTRLPGPPVVSVLRGFSAPVKLKMERTPEELAFLLAHDPDTFTRWDAGQQLASLAILERLDAAAERSAGSLLTEAYTRLATAGEWADLSYLALLLSLPSEDAVGSLQPILRPVAVFQAREALRSELARDLEQHWQSLYHRHHRDEFNRFDAEAIGRRRLKNICLDYLNLLDQPESHELVLKQFRSSRTMTDRVAALSAMMNSHHPLKDDCLEDFYRQWREDDLVVNKWFALQATCRLPGALERVEKLMTHPAFDSGTPNHVRSLIGSFSQANPPNFHAEDGAGYRFLADQVIRLNGINPQIAARLLTALTSWRRYDERHQKPMHAALTRVAETPDISRDVFEVASKALAD
jgi:aminopeptidase N